MNGAGMLSRIIGSMLFSAIMAIAPARGATVLLTPDSHIFPATAVGTTVSTTFAVTFSGFEGQTFSSLNIEMVNAPFSAIDNCNSFTACTATISFAPTSVGPFEDTFYFAFLVYQNETGTVLSASDFGGGLSGQGVPSAVPLPSAVLLFAGGLGVLGFLGWRKRSA